MTLFLCGSYVTEGPRVLRSLVVKESQISTYSRTSKKIFCVTTEQCLHWQPLYEPYNDDAASLGDSRPEILMVSLSSFLAPVSKREGRIP